jgi:hypothetical protein
MGYFARAVRLPVRELTLYSFPRTIEPDYWHSASLPHTHIDQVLQCGGYVRDPWGISQGFEITGSKRIRILFEPVISIWTAHPQQIQTHPFGIPCWVTQDVVCASFLG